MAVMTSPKLPYAGTRAAAMLKEALARYTSQHKGGLRALAGVIGMNQATVLSHMATGRIGIPLDRVQQFAEVLDLNVEAFSLAVIEQREPAMLSLLQSVYRVETEGTDSAERAGLIREIRAAKVLSPRQISLIRDIVRDPELSTRVVTGRESELIWKIREARPMGPEDGEWDKLTALIDLILA